MVLTLEVPDELDVEIPADEPVSLESFETIGTPSETIDVKIETTPEQSETQSATVDPVAAAPPVETPSVATPEPPTPTKPELISDGIAEWKIASDRLEHEIADLVVERAALSERAKSIKKRIDCLAEDLLELREKGPQPIWRTPAPQPPQTRQVQSQSQFATSNQVTTSPPADDNGVYTTTSASADDGKWRTVPISELQLKPNITVKLQDADIETIGQLEDLRADISNRRREWPKGIGKAKITEIEDAIITWLTKNRDAAVFQQQQVSASASADSPPSPPDQPANAEPIAEPDLPTLAEWEAMHDQHCEFWLFDRADWIVAKDPDGQLNPAMDDPKFWNSGSDAYKRADSQITDCPYIPGSEMDDWLRGWLFAEREYEDTEQPEPPASSRSKSLEAVSIDDL